ncbi:MAG: phosphotransferase [Motilibacteraceae bacterium]
MNAVSPDGPEESVLDGGNAGGAVRVGDTIRKPTGAWSAAIDQLLGHLANVGFTRAPRPLGRDQTGRQILSMLPGETVGSRKPWPRWVYDDTTLDQVGMWLRDYHQAVRDFSPDPSSSWRGGSSWSPGLIIGHNDAAPYNAAWQDGRLQGFFDWDFAGPVTPGFDLAFCCMSWVPLHARQVAEVEGFRDFTRRPQRLRRLLAAYGWDGDIEELRRLMMDVVVHHIRDVEALAAHGDPAFQRMVENGVLDSLQLALSEVESVEL